MWKVCYSVVKSCKNEMSHSRIPFNSWTTTAHDLLQQKMPTVSTEQIMDDTSGAKYQESVPPVLLPFYPVISFIDYCWLRWYGQPQINPFSSQCLAWWEAKSIDDDSVESLSVCDTGRRAAWIMQVEPLLTLCFLCDATGGLQPHRTWSSHNLITVPPARTANSAKWRAVCGFLSCIDLHE